MTLDTIFDMASLSKCLSTATAIMQLYEQGKLHFDDLLVQYLPDFASATDPASQHRHAPHAPYPHLGRSSRRRPQRPLGPCRPQQGRRHPPRPHHPTPGRPRLALPLLRHQLHSARRPRRKTKWSAPRRVRRAAHLHASRHERNQLSSLLKSLRDLSTTRLQHPSRPG